MKRWSWTFFWLWDFSTCAAPYSTKAQCTLLCMPIKFSLLNYLLQSTHLQFYFILRMTHGSSGTPTWASSVSMWPFLMIAVNWARFPYNPAGFHYDFFFLWFQDLNNQLITLRIIHKTTGTLLIVSVNKCWSVCRSSPLVLVWFCSFIFDWSNGSMVVWVPWR